MSFCVMVVRSHLTKKAASARSPSRPPLRNSLNRKSSIERRILAHSGSSLGSKTAHCVDVSIERSR
jgi:hypothetical protein